MATKPVTRPEKLAGSAKVVVRRVVQAPRALVYELFTDAERMPKWILDGGTATLDVRVGGRYHMDMHYKGKSYAHSGEYLEVVPPERLVLTWVSEGTNWLPSIVTVELKDLGGRTEVVLTHEGLPDEASAEGHRGGWDQIMGWLEREIRGA